MLISSMPPTQPSMRTPSTIIYDFPRESGYNKPELNVTLNKNFRIGRGMPELPETIKQLNDVSAWPAGWNGYDAAAPNPESIVEAKLFIRQMCKDACDATAAWQDPHVTADANGDVVFEWWKGNKKLTIYVSPTGIEYIKVWGPDIINEMADGEIESTDDRRDLWSWFVN